MKEAIRRRFYKRVDIVAAEEGFRIALDGRPVHTPGGASLSANDERIARLLAREWDSQDGVIRPHAMPVTRIVGTGLDAVAADRERYIARALAYAESDVLCYRADAPPDLVDRQNRSWDPLLDWAETRLGARLTATVGVVPHPQDSGALAALRRRLAAFGDVDLSAVNFLVAAMGSLVLGLAVADGRLTGEQAFALSQVDEIYQAEKWGQDEEAAARRARLRADVMAAAALFAPQPSV